MNYSKDLLKTLARMIDRGLKSGQKIAVQSIMLNTPNHLGQNFSTMIRCAETDEDLRRCFPVVVQLRSHLSEAEFLNRARRQMEQGYQIAFLEVEAAVRAIAGFRILEMLYKGRFLYVDDLVTDTQSRSQGYGEALFNWLVEYAHTHHCTSLSLDSGVQRLDAHRFYFRQRMGITAYHFNLPLPDPPPPPTG